MSAGCSHRPPPADDPGHAGADEDRSGDPESVPPDGDEAAHHADVQSSVVFPEFETHRRFVVVHEHATGVEADASVVDVRDHPDPGEIGRSRVVEPNRPGIAIASDDRHRSIGVVLVAASFATTLLAAALGAWAAGRALSPVGDVRRVAASLAAGELDTRLQAPADADLASLAASFNGMAQSLEDRIERDARFASEVSHELRSPLMTLSASVEVLNNNRDSMPERGQQALGLLNDDIQRFTQLVEDLLEISRFDVGTASLQSQPLHFVEFVRQAVTHSTRPDSLVVATPDVGDLVVSADKRRLAQVIANLIENADKYGSGGIEVQISTYGEAAILAIEDEGPGVAEAEREIIFDRFSRGSSGGRRGYDTGSGLGLSLVAEHVGLHGGRIWVEDRLDGNRGARFVITLPIGDPVGEDFE